MNSSTYRLLFAAFGLAGSAAQAGQLALADSPLNLSSWVPPNVMLMLDNSGSMQHIVPAAPYDADTVYLASCPKSNTIPAGSSVWVRLDNHSNPWVRLSSGSYYPFGTGHGQKCFATHETYRALLDAHGSTSVASYAGNYLNWYFNPKTDPTGCPNNWSSGRKPCTESRMIIAQRAGKNLLDIMSGDLRVGLSSYNLNDGGKLNEIVEDLTAAKRTKIKTTIDSLTPNNNTPLTETLADIGHYFSQGAGTLALHPDDGSPQLVTRSEVFKTLYARNSSWSKRPDPIKYSCQKSFAVLLTDGRPHQDRDISQHLRDYTGDCAAGLCDATPTNQSLPAGALGTTAWKNGTKVGRAYETLGSDYLDDVAQALFEIDLRPDLVDPGGVKNNLSTYIISFADESLMNDPLMKDTVARAGGEFFVAGNEAQLSAAFQAALASILSKTGSSSSAVASAGSFSRETMMYQARFNSADWSGQLLAFAMDDDADSPTYGLIQKSGPGPDGAMWDAGANSRMPAWNERTIITMNGGGVPFRWEHLSPAQQASLGNQPALLNYLRGDHSLEKKNGGPYRNRSTRLGDIVNSAPVFVGAPGFRYPGSLEAAVYASFKASHKNRKKMIYVGANDGMLHGFNAETGVEEMAYVPARLFGKLGTLASTGYTHKYFVDGSPTVIDAYVGNRWRSMLVGGYNKGGQGIYALDVTDPASFSESPGDAKSLVRWEFTDADDADLGYTYSRPAIVKLQDGTWAAVFGNGYNNTEADGAASSTGDAVLYVVDLWTGKLIEKISTGTGSAQDPTGQSRPNGLATVAPADPDGDYVVDAVYSGDLFGNLWKFDLSGSHGSAVRLFTTCGEPCNAATRQAITSRPIVGPHPNAQGLLVYFGTGKYLEAIDNAEGPVQSVYAIWDPNDKKKTATIRREELLQQDIIAEVKKGEFLVRVTSDHPISWDKHKGWYIDLVSPVHGSQGERQVTDALLRNGRLIFTTLIPSQDRCQPGGVSWLMEMDAGSGSRLEYSPFDADGDGRYTSADYVSVTIDGETKQVPPSGIRTEGGGAATPTVVMKGSDETKCISSAAGMQCIHENPGDNAVGRQSWREVGR